MEKVKKKMLVAFKNRAHWQNGINTVLHDLVNIVGLELGEEEQSYLATFPEAVANLIYAGILQSLVVEFGDEACEVELIYYSGDDERDDLDLSLLEAIEWQVNELRVRVLVDDLSYASSISCSTLQNFDSGKLTISIEQAASDEAEAGDEAGGDEEVDDETRIGNVDNEQEDDNGKENE